MRNIPGYAGHGSGGLGGAASWAAAGVSAAVRAVIQGLGQGGVRVGEQVPVHVHRGLDVLVSQAQLDLERAGARGDEPGRTGVPQVVEAVRAGLLGEVAAWAAVLPWARPSARQPCWQLGLGREGRAGGRDEHALVPLVVARGVALDGPEQERVGRGVAGRPGGLPAWGSRKAGMDTWRVWCDLVGPRTRDGVRRFSSASFRRPPGSPERTRRT